MRTNADRLKHYSTGEKMNFVLIIDKNKKFFSLQLKNDT